METEFAIHIYQNNDESALLIIPKESKNFIELAHVDFDIHEKLGSYDIAASVITKSKNFKLISVEKLHQGSLSIHCELQFKKKTIQQQLIINEYSPYPLKKEGLYFYLDQKKIPNEINQITFNIPNTYEAIFGGGIQFSHCNLKGHQFPLIVEENGVGRGDKGPTFWANLLGAAGNEYATYAPSTYFVTNQQQYYQLFSRHNNHIWQVDFSKNNIVSYTFQALENPFYVSPKIYTGYNNLLTTNYYKEIPLLDDWMYGYILGIQGGKQKVDSIIQVMQSNGIEISAIWIQDWVGKRQTSIGSRLQWDWRANEDYYPNLKEWIDSLHQENIRVLGYINPYFVEDGEQTKEGLANDYFVKINNNEPYLFKAGGFKAYMLDLNNPNAITWVQTIIKNNLIDNGFDGWMCDFGEWYPFQNIDYGEHHPSLYHNQFPQIWTTINHDIARNSDKEFFIFNRSWYDEMADTPPIMWLGDQMGSFGKHDGLASAVNAYNSASLSGFPIVHSDIGGYTAIQLGPIKHLRDDEVLQRWIEMEAFTPLWRSHEGLIPANMSQLYQDEEMMQFFAYFDSIHRDLIPYFKTVNQQAIQQKSPMVIHPFLLYPEDENTWDIQYQFFVGEDLLLAPVIEKESEQVNVYLPNGKWQHYFTNKIYNGNQWITIDAPIGQPAVFWKKK